MKKIIFVALGAISIVVAGMLVVACTPDVANSPDVQVNEVVQHAPAAAEQGSEDAWADFMAEVEALNERYASNGDGPATRNYLDPDVLIPNPNWPDIPGWDIKGALVAVEMTRILNVNGEIRIMDHVTVIIAAVYSHIAKLTAGASQDAGANYSISLRNIASISNLTNSHAAVLIGTRHNQLLSALYADGFDSSDMSYEQMMQAFIDKYEDLYAAVPRDAREILLNSRVNRTPNMTDEVESMNEQFKTTTSSMTLARKRNYTDEYLGIVGTAQVDAYEKFQMSMYAAMSYYSGALWLVQ